MKMFDAHLAELAGKADRVFVPRILSGRKGHISCPKLAALPDAAGAQFGPRIPILTIDVNEDKVPLPTSLAALGGMLGAGKKASRDAAHRAMEAMAGNLAGLAARRTGEPGSILILAHPYNLYDDFFSGPIVRKLASLKVGVNLVEFDRADIPSGPIKWDTCSKMYDTLRRLDPKISRGVIQISSFNCGCDSIVGSFYHEILARKRIPFMTLIIDEHTSNAGLGTRLEAFVDSCRW